MLRHKPTFIEWRIFTIGIPTESFDDRLTERLALFFKIARAVLYQETNIRATVTSAQHDRIKCFIDDLRVPLDKAVARSCANPWEVAGLFSDEVRVSAVLASLWDRHRYGDEGRAFLTRFFARAGDDFPDDEELARGYFVQTEHCLNGATADRVDITVETHSSIVGIEVKIYAGEGTDQLARYVAAIQMRAKRTGRQKSKVIFLSPYIPTGNPVGVSTIDWRTVGEVAGEANRSSRAGWLIGQFGEYCRLLGS